MPGAGTKDAKLVSHDSREVRVAEEAGIGFEMIKLSLCDKIIVETLPAFRHMRCCMDKRAAISFENQRKLGKIGALMGRDLFLVMPSRHLSFFGQKFDVFIDRYGFIVIAPYDAPAMFADKVHASPRIRAVSYNITRAIDGIDTAFRNSLKRSLEGTQVGMDI